MLQPHSNSGVVTTRQILVAAIRFIQLHGHAPCDTLRDHLCNYLTIYLQIYITTK